jgi:uncharacterized ubiquitin-like protein YukD
MNSNYDSYGVLNDVQEINIPIGTVVEYIDAKSSNQKTVKVKLTGVWDGTKVSFEDKDKTIVRTTRWLILTEKFKENKMTKQTVSLGTTYFLDLGSQCPAEIIPIAYLDNGKVLVAYQNSWAGRTGEFPYDLFGPEYVAPELVSDEK